MRAAFAALLVAACGLRPRAGLAALPTPGVISPAGSGFAYVGTLNPTVVPFSALPPIDLAPVTVTTTAGPGGSTDVQVDGGILDAVHFGAGLSQLFSGVASIDAFMRAEIGSIHLAASAGAQSAPLRYGAGFPGALADNPFYARAVVTIGAGFVDIVTVPATQDAPHQGDLTTVTIEALADCAHPATFDDDSDLRGNVGVSLSRADGTDLGGVATTMPPGFSHTPGCPFGASRMLQNIPVLTPIALQFSLGVQVSVMTGLALQGFVHGGDWESDHASIDLLNTGEVLLINSEGKGATGSTGHDYTTLNGGPTITTTTTTTTTSTFVPPATLPSCGSGYCGDGVVQADCAETCECPLAGGQAVAVCDAATSTPPLAPDCARCAGCQVDLSQCAIATTTSTAPATTSTIAGATTTTTAAGTATTSTTVPCLSARCILDAGLRSPSCAGERVPPSVTRKFDQAVHLIDEADASVARKAKRLLRHARATLGLADKSVRNASRGKKPKLTSGCATDIRRADDDVRAGLGK